MRSALLKTLPILVAISIDGFAQDSKFPPKGQQIPASECLTIKGLWEGARSPVLRMSMNRGWPTSPTGETSGESVLAMTDLATIFPC